MMKVKWIATRPALTAAAVILLAGGMVATASPEKGTRTKARPAKDANMVIANTFALADLDANGEITAIEFLEHVQVFSFKRLDADADKSVSLEEWGAVEVGPEGAALFGELDKNKDGKLSMKEFKAKPKGHEAIRNIFSTLDTDGDGVLRLQEFDVKE